MPDTRVIDLSHWNWIPENLHAAAQAGVWGMIHKITEATTIVDDKYPARFYLAREAGMMVGGYHFLRPNDMQRQADFFLDRLAGYMDEQTLLAADYEDSRVSLADLLAFIKAVEKRAKRECIVYSGHVLKEAINKGQNPGTLAERRLWLAQYTKAGQPDLPNGWDSWWIWQFTDRGTVPGVNPPTDLNAYQSTRENLKAEWSGTGAEPETEPIPGAPVIKITVPAGTRVEVVEV